MNTPRNSRITYGVGVGVGFGFATTTLAFCALTLCPFSRLIIKGVTTAPVVVTTEVIAAAVAAVCSGV